MEETRFRITQWANALNVSSYYITQIGLLDKYKSNRKERKHKTSNGPKACDFKWTSFHNYTTLVLSQSWEKTRWQVPSPTIELSCTCHSRCSTGVSYQHVITELSSLGTIHPLRKKNTALINAAWIRQCTWFAVSKLNFHDMRKAGAKDNTKETLNSVESYK